MLNGRTNHAGSPMEGRQDSCLGAVRLIENIRNYAAQKKPQTHVTVGIFNVDPGRMGNVIPGQTYFSIDFREEELGILQDLESFVKSNAETVAADHGLKVEISTLLRVDPVPFEPMILDTIKTVSGELGVRWQSIASGAGHDAQIIGPVVPSAMIFVPSCDGRSHCPEELTQKEDIANSTNVLLNTLLELAQ
jgi:hydantoinase/carbamoylase family amidase